MKEVYTFDNCQFKNRKMDTSRQKIKVYIEQGRNFSSPLIYIWKRFAHHKKLNYFFCDNKTESDIIIDSTNASHFSIAENFYECISQQKYSYDIYFTSDCIIRNFDGKPDYLTTCFYMINSIQEYKNAGIDELGGFKYESSYQYKFKNIQENIVQKYFDLIAESLPILKSSQKVKSKIFLSHDIDTVYGAWMEDGMAALQQGNFLHLFKLFFNAAVGNPDWLNIDKIMKAESECDFKSAFYWIVNKSKHNADYLISENKIKKNITAVENNGFESGLHKSISNESIDDEISKAPFLPFSNRYHFLKINLPYSYEEINKSNIKVDSSLGFSEQFGFRNSYGLPFQPYDFKTQKEFAFVESPLLVMDRTFYKYLKTPVENVANTVISFLEKNNSDCVFSILWHNNFFGSVKYKGYMEEYKKILLFLYENKYQSVISKEIYKEYFIRD